MGQTVAQKQTLEPNDKKKMAAIEACRLVKSGMVMGLGTGSTVQYALEELARRIKTEGLKIQGVPTSTKTEAEAQRLGIPLTTLEEHSRLDLTIDGADEIDNRLNLIKGGGGALLREKVIAESSRTVVIIADDSKFVTQLGTTFPVPVEFVPFARVLIERGLVALGATPSLRLRQGKPYVTDNHCWIIDARFPAINKPEKVETEITMLPGVADCGIFTGLADIAFIAFNEGVRRFQLPRQLRADL